MGIFYESNYNKPKKGIIMVWIDKKINNSENKSYQKTFLELGNINLKCFDNVYDGIEFLKTINFERTLIITSGSIYSEFYEKFKNNINNLTIVPRIIIFTSNKKRFIDNNKNILPINHTFYNAGGVEDTFSPVKEFILSKQLLSENYLDPNIYEREKEDKFNFELITEKNQLILPIYFPEYIKIPTEKEIQNFNQYMFKNFKSNNYMYNLFSQLIEVSNIPIPIISKYWARSYTFESDFYKKMNEDLLKNKIRKYLTFIQMMYEAVKNNYLKPQYDKKLYRGTIVSKKEYDKIIKYMNKKIKGLPAAIVYGRSFFSFSDDINVANSFKQKKKAILKNDEMVGLFIIEQCPQNDKLCTGNASIKEYSYYKRESEILFFPFSSFEIKKAEKINEQEFIITLNYLGKYQYLFQGEDPKEILYRVPETSKIAKQIFMADILDHSLKLPKWAIELIVGASGAIAGATFGGAIGSFIPGAGTAFGSLIGGIAGGTIGAGIGVHLGGGSDSD